MRELWVQLVASFSAICLVGAIALFVGGTSSAFAQRLFVCLYAVGIALSAITVVGGRFEGNSRFWRIGGWCLLLCHLLVVVVPVMLIFIMGPPPQD